MSSQSPGAVAAVRVAGAASPEAAPSNGRNQSPAAQPPQRAAGNGRPVLRVPAAGVVATGVSDWPLLGGDLESSSHRAPPPLRGMWGVRDGRKCQGGATGVGGCDLHAHSATQLPTFFFPLPGSHTTRPPDHAEGREKKIKKTEDECWRLGVCTRSMASIRQSSDPKWRPLFCPGSAGTHLLTVRSTVTLVVDVPLVECYYSVRTYTATLTWGMREQSKGSPS